MDTRNEDSASTIVPRKRKYDSPSNTPDLVSASNFAPKLDHQGHRKASRIIPKTKNNAKFHRFMDLPLELRDKVNRYVIPDRITLCMKGEGSPLVSYIPLLIVSRRVRQEVKKLVFTYTEFEIVLADRRFQPGPLVGLTFPTPNSPCLDNYGLRPNPLKGTLLKGQLLPFPSQEQAKALFTKIKRLGITFNLNAAYDLEALVLLYDRFQLFHQLIGTQSFQAFHLRVHIDAAYHDRRNWMKPANRKYAFVKTIREAAMRHLGRHANWEYTCLVYGLPWSEMLPTGALVYHDRCRRSQPTRINEGPLKMLAGPIDPEPELLYDAWLAFRALVEHIAPSLRDDSKRRLDRVWKEAYCFRALRHYFTFLDAMETAIKLWDHEPRYRRLAGKGSRLVKMEHDHVEKAMELRKNAIQRREACLKNRGYLCFLNYPVVQSCFLASHFH